MGQFAGDTLNGDDGQDVLVGDHAELLRNQSNNNITSTYTSIGGDDTLTGGVGSDILIGGAAQDTLVAEVSYGAGAEADFLVGDNVLIKRDNVDAVLRLESLDEAIGNNDIIHGSGGVDFVIGGAGDDMIYGYAGDNVLVGDSGVIVRTDGDSDDNNNIFCTAPTAGVADTISASDGRDIIIGGVGEDILNGNAGNDVIVGDHLQSSMTILIRSPQFKHLLQVSPAASIPLRVMLELTSF